MTTITIPDLNSLEAMDVAGRVDRLRASLDAQHIEALLVTNLTNIRYLTGFTGSSAMVLVTPNDLWFVTDGRYTTQSAAELAAAGVAANLEVPARMDDQRRVLASAASGVAGVALEADHISWAQQQRLASTWFPDIDLIASSGLVEGLRLVKDGGEVARMGAAAAIADVAFERLRHRLSDRPTESEFALELDTEMRRLGAADVSFETIVAAGPNAARPHHRPSERTITSGDLVVVDFGALVDGYHSDMTRTQWVGEPTATQRRMWDVVAEAQQAGVDAVRAGVTAGQVDRICRDVIDASGWGDAFVHSTGHGVGLDIHEQPRLGADSPDCLADGWVVTVEPGVYLADHGGVRIEDTVLVGPSGCTALTRAPKIPAV